MVSVQQQLVSQVQAPATVTQARAGTADLFEFAAFLFVLPGSVAVSVVACLAAMWAVNGGDVFAAVLVATVASLYALVAAPLIAAAVARA